MSLNNLYWYKAVLRSIYDADTIRADIDLGFGIILKGSNGKGESLRFARIDAPEIRGDERPKGLEAKVWLESQIKIGEELLLHTVEWEGKYGRYICDVYKLDSEGNAINLNDEMVKVGHAEYKKY